MDLKGKVVVFTGTLALMTRNEARAIAVKLGAILSDTVTVKADYLIVGDKPGRKVRDAKRLGVQIIGEQDWYKLCPKGTLVSSMGIPLKPIKILKPMTIINKSEVSAPELDLD